MLSMTVCRVIANMPKDNVMLHFSKKQLAVIAGLFLLLIAAAILTFKTQFPAADLDTDAMYTFYTLFDGNRSIIFFFAGLLLAIANIFPILYFKYYHNNFISLICTRIPYKMYVKKSIVTVFFLSFLFYLLLNAAVLLAIHTLYVPISFHSPQTAYQFVFQDPIFDFLFYWLSGSIGYGIYHVFLLSIIPLIKNEFLYRAVPLINFVIGLLSFIFIKSALMPMQGVIPFVDEISSLMVPLNLYTPGLFIGDNTFLSFLISVIFYGILTTAALAISYKKVKNDD